ncbi:hypothetical protein XaplCFBP3123_20985 [Xanthomonas arboricola pv. populi]|nr:hypothetical protein XaplCFBP3123_20985 [Xanthomonas arboricola pv. populi]
MIIMVVVAVVVTYLTAGATNGYFAAAFSAASSTAGAVAASAATYAVAGAAGSIASQGVGSAMGQTSFSWRNVAASSIASAATAGFSTAVSASVGPVVGAMSTAAVGNVSNYLANRLVGNEASFSWRSVAASAVTAGITQQLAPTIARSIGVDTMKYGQATVAGITGGVVSASLRRGSIDYTNLAVDAFSNVLINSLTQSSSTGLFDPDTATASSSGGGAPGRYVRDRNGDLTLDTVEVRATRSNISSIQIRASDQELRDQALLRAVGEQTLENIRADRRRSNAIDVGAFQRSNALDIGAINAARMAPSTAQPVAPMPVNREAIPVEPNSISGWEVAGSFVEGVGNAFVGVGREVADTPLRVGDMLLAAAAVTTNLFRDEGDYWLPEMNSGMSRDYERSGQAWDQFALDHNPLYAATVGLGTAIGNGAGAAVVDNDYRPLANLGGEFAGGLLVGKAMNRYGNYGVMIDDIGASGLGRSQAGSVGVRFGEVQRKIPLGFRKGADFEAFGDSLHDGLNTAGYKDVDAAFQGSSVTGQAYKAPHDPFDVGRTSDYDIALSSPELFQRAKDVGVGLRQQGVRTGPLGPEHLERLGLSGLNKKLSAEADRPVNFMIYNSIDDAITRSPSILIPRNN